MADHDEFWPSLEPQTEWICRQVRRLGVPERDVPDVTQDVLVELYKTWRDYDEQRALRAWIFGFAFRVTSAYRRRAENRLVSLEPEPYAAVDIHSALRQLEERQELELVQRALDTLADDRREVFIMARIEEIPIVDVAETLEINVNTAYTRLRAANADFASAIRRLRAQRGEP